MPDTRSETDSMGTIDVPDDCYWGAQTQRSLHFFRIGSETMPEEFIRAYGFVKKAASIVNRELGRMDPGITAAICAAADEVIAGELARHFPLAVWQTGSGTQTNMNLNEVISNRAIELLGGQKGSKDPVHPNDHVNLSQSSNDTFPSAMSIAGVFAMEDALLPAVTALRAALASKAEAWKDIVKVGRTHLMDATPLTVGQSISAMVHQLDSVHSDMAGSLVHLRELAIGATAVGTGLNSPPEWAGRMTEAISRLTGKQFVPAPNRFAALAAHDAFVATHATMKSLACVLMKIANDLRWLASGPRCGIGEFLLPANEPGSSIMPGKVNPTQCEAMTMVCVRVIGNDTTMSLAGASGNFELNAYKPVLMHTFLETSRLLADACSSFTSHCVAGLQLNKQRIDELLHRSLMLVTALVPRLGYDLASQVAHKANTEQLSVREAALAMRVMTAEELDDLLVPENMLGPS